MHHGCDGDRDPHPSTAHVDPVELRTATRTWFSISLQTFGGPAAQIATMHRVLVDERRWIGERRFLHALNFCTLLPGPEAQQLATYCGWLLNGARGGLVAGSLFILPGFVVLLGVSLLYAGYGDTALITALFAGVAPAVLPIVVQAVQRISRRALDSLLTRGLAVAAFLALFLFNVPFPIVIAVAAVVGLGAGRYRPGTLQPRQVAHADSNAPTPLIADDALHGVHGTTRRFVLVLVTGLAIWAVPIVVVAAWEGTDSTLFDLAVFFSFTAMITFGGAYAVLTYVGQRAVNVYGWLFPSEMATALALAETTPGPLIQIVQFVGFMAAFRNPGDLDPWVAGVVGTLIVVWVTFVPCFLWIFLGAPHIEALRHSVGLTHALTAVTAAVVGVIANLAAYFTIHTLFTDVVDNRQIGPFELTVPVWSTLEWQAVAITTGATLLLYRFHLSVARTVAIAGAAGGILYLVTT
jgi:chromate transporter